MKIGGMEDFSVLFNILKSGIVGNGVLGGFQAALV